jgi:Fic family protein
VHPSILEPLSPDLTRPAGAKLTELALSLEREAAALGGALPKPTAGRVANLIRIANSYYSNRIEGNDTRPGAIEEAMAKTYAEDSPTRALQRQAQAHVEVEREAEGWLRSEPNIEPASRAYLERLHRAFYDRTPEALRWVEDPTTGRREPVIPGELRSYPVTVGRHRPPEAADVPALLARTDEVYRVAGLGGPNGILTIAAAHHRLMWIHPFGDGNGRVVRLATHALMRAHGIGGLGLWSPSRGLARSRNRYMAAMADADQPRRNDLDGRGHLSAEALERFVAYFLESCLDQVRYMREMLALDELGDRLAAYVRLREEGIVHRDRPRLRAEAGRLLQTLLVRSTLSRGDSARVMGLSERTASPVLSVLLKERLLGSDSPKGPVYLRFPVSTARWWFPQLFPEDE